MSFYTRLRAALLAEESLAVVTVIRGPAGLLGSKWLVYPAGQTVAEPAGALLDSTTLNDALNALAEGQSGTVEYPSGLHTFIEVYSPSPTLYVIGGVHTAIPLITFAKALGFHTVLIDARSGFATPQRFPHVDELIIGWPDEVLAQRTLDALAYVVVLTHDPKLDDPAVTAALAGQPRYIGVLGSPKTHASRVARLRAAGISAADIARLYAPVGLDLGARSPEEIAVSIIAEIVAVRHGRPQPLLRPNRPLPVSELTASSGYRIGV